MQYVDQNRIWADSLIKSVVQVLDRPKYGFNVVLIRKSENDNENEKVEFVAELSKFVHSVDKIKIRFVVYDEHIFVRIAQCFVHKNFSVTQTDKKFFEKNFNKGRIRKIRKWAICAINKLHRQIKTEHDELVSEDVVNA
jgi:hypothetical protein